MTQPKKSIPREVFLALLCNSMTLSSSKELLRVGRVSFDTAKKLRRFLYHEFFINQSMQSIFFFAMHQVVEEI